MSPAPEISQEFSLLGLPEPILQAIAQLGYNEPTPIQAQAIPALLSGQDVLGQAQTGTGKTAAFALPLLTKVKAKLRAPQVLVLVPTRELALQVAEACASFAVNMPEIKILPVYGGQGYSTQLTALAKGVHIVIGTPGRVMDHMRKEALVLDNLKTLILDEADEMLRMGFAEDVEWILESVPEQRQIGLFSATMPEEIKKIVHKYLHEPQHIQVKASTTTAAKIKQYYWFSNNLHKLDALSRIIESEDSDGIIVFAKTKHGTEELAQQLNQRGIHAMAINGDLVQKQRERLIDNLKSGRLKVLVATDVAARGIDVDRITHVINYDAPTNPESYVHRIGRTGRAGRTGTAITFISPREKYLLRAIERVTKQQMEEMPTPTIKTINEKRINTFKQRLTEVLQQDLSFYDNLIKEYCMETGTHPNKAAAGLAKLLHGEKDLLISKTSEPKVEYVQRAERNFRSDRGERGAARGERAPRERSYSRGGERSDSRSSPRGERSYSRGGERSESRGERSFSRGERSESRGERSFSRGERSESRSSARGNDSRSERSPRNNERNARSERWDRDAKPAFKARAKPAGKPAAKRAKPKFDQKPAAKKQRREKA